MTARKPVYVGLGSNVGRRMVYLSRALDRLNQLPGTRLKKVSRVYESSPVGPRQRWFLNAVARVDTTLDPLRLLAHVKNIEQELGRKKRHRWGPREIDLDLLLSPGQKKKNKILQLPHPRWKERKFVLWPLAALAPGLRDPETGRTVASWRQKLTDPDQRIKLYPRRLRDKKN